MSQILTRPRIQSTGILQDIYFAPKRVHVSSARPALCEVCGKGLADGYSIAIKVIDGRGAILCSVHGSD